MNVCVGKTETKQTILLIQIVRLHPFSDISSLCTLYQNIEVESVFRYRQIQKFKRICDIEKLVIPTFKSTYAYIFVSFPLPRNFFSLEIYPIKQNFHYPILYRKIMKWEKIQHHYRTHEIEKYVDITTFCILPLNRDWIVCI